MTNWYRGMQCRSCRLPMQHRGVVVQGFVIHDRMVCRATLDASLRAMDAQTQARRIAEASELLQLGGIRHPTRPAGRAGETAAMRGQAAVAAAKTGGSLKRAQADEALAPARKEAIKRCLDGACGRATLFSATQCTHCTRSLHVAECGGCGSARASMGLVKCFYCRAEEMAPDQVPTAARLDAAMDTMIIQLSLGQEGSAAGSAAFNQLEQDFALQQGLAGEELLLPRHREETFLAFLTFCFRDAGRARSMKSLWRNLPQVFKACELPDLTQRWPVKKHFKELQDQWSEEPDPCASCTERMAESLLLHVIPSERRPKAPRVGSDDTLLERRDVVQTACGCYAGTRIGETADSGQGHGVTCSGVCIVEDEDTGEAFIDIIVPTAKTGVSRYTGMWQYPSENRDIDMVAAVRALWDAMGAAVGHETRGGLRVSWADHWVVRVGLFGMSTPDFTRLHAELKRSGCLSAMKHADTSYAYAVRRGKATAKGSETKRWVNVAAGPRECAYMARLMELLRHAGFTAHLVPAPLITASTGGAKPRPTLMPLSSSTITGGKMKEFLQKAVVHANRDPSNPDPDWSMPLAGLDSAKLGTHSLRRLADKRMRRYCAAHDIPLSKVDSMLGWKQTEHKLNMQEHYDEDDLRARMEVARITAHW